MKIILAIILSCFCGLLKADDERILANAKINGRPIQFIVDTGMNCNATLFRKAAQRLGLKVSPTNRKAFDGQIAIGTTELCNLDFGTTNG
ncbi:MAG: aspartyl protease family protein, partial [Limisphaerales bacterium]